MKRLIMTMVMLLFVAALCYAADKEMVSESGKIHAENSVACVDCHGTDNPTKAADVSACFECHSDGDDTNTFTGAGKKAYAFDGGNTIQVNPHFTHLVELPCTECHKTHEQSTIYCNKCHMFSDMQAK